VAACSLNQCGNYVATIGPSQSGQFSYPRQMSIHCLELMDLFDAHHKARI